jgi:molybdopterin converting factor small subunit
MKVKVRFHSYCRELAGCSDADLETHPGARLEELQEEVYRRFQRLEPMRRSTLVAVGVEYEFGDYVLKEGDEVSFFPPVQGG